MLSFRHTVETTLGTFEKDLRDHFRYAVVYTGRAAERGASEAAGCYGFARDAEKAEHLANLARTKGYVGVEVALVAKVLKVAEDAEPRRLPDGGLREP
jgi:hypothetical protein